MQYGECLQMTNTLIYKFQPTNMADNKDDVIFFLGAGTLYINYVCKLYIYYKKNPGKVINYVM